MEKDEETTRTGGMLRKARLAAAAAVLTGFASTAVVYGDDGDVTLLPWWV